MGMLLGSEELAGLVHVPDRSVLSPKLRAHSGKTKRAPLMVEGHPFVLGLNAHLGQEVTVTLSDEQRLRHMHVIGATGTGKSTLLLNMIAGDIRAGRGVAVLDPHGDLIDGAIKHIPDERLKDVVLVDPSDTEYPIGLNLLSARSEAEKVILSSDLVALFRRFATSWGDQMTSVLANAVNAVLESEGGGTLIDLRRFLVERGFRERFLQSVGDPNIAYYWQHEFHLQKTNSVAPILTRLDTFLRPRIVRNMMAQKVGLDFGEILNKGKVLLVKLPQGLIGEENSYLLGTLVVAKLHQAAQARQGLAPEERTPFFFYIDEFQHFVTPSMSAILSGARKYGLGLVLAHQDLEQLFQKDAELAGSVMSNPGIRVCFRSGDKDAARLEGGFSHFDATDLQNLGTGQAIVRVLAKDNDFNLAFSLPPKVGPEAAEGKRKTVVENSRSRYAAHESEVEEVLRASLGPRPAPERQRPPEVRVENPILISEELPQAAEEEAPVKDLQTEAEKFVEKEAERERQREHRFSQEFVKKVAEARNFKAVLEEPVNDNTGKVDVSLVRDSLRIACEISVTNTPEYEVQNISKCLKAGFDLVFMVSGDERHLNEIRALAAKEIPTEHHGKVFFTSKEGFVRELDTFLSLKTGPVETRTKGYRVKVSYGGAEGAAAQQRLLKEVLSASARGKG